MSSAPTAIRARLTGDDSERLAVIREQEQKNAAKVLGVSEVVFLGHPDGWLTDSPDSAASWCGSFANTARAGDHPLTLPANTWGTTITASRAGLHGCGFSLLPRHLFYPEHKAEGLTPFKVGEMYLTGAEEPNKYVEITETFDLKMKAIACHISQVGHTGDWESWVKARRAQAEAMSKERGMPLSEAFHRIEIRR